MLIKIRHIENSDSIVAFESLGICKEIAKAAVMIGWKEPSTIQKEVVPHLLQGKDIIGLAQTGSGKTGAFALPIIQGIIENPQPAFALILSPTRELAIQTTEQIVALGCGLGIKCCPLVGGIDHIQQAIGLAKKPHVIVGTPGRVVDHLHNTKGFNLHTIKQLVLDEADRLLNMDFEQEISLILKVIPRERRTQLFSATMTKKLSKLQKACLKNPVKIEMSDKYQTVDSLRQQYLFIPLKHKDCYLIQLLREQSGSTTMIFSRTCETTRKIDSILRHFNFNSLPIHGQMTQHKRLVALKEFKSGKRSILVATDLASRGLDILAVDLVVNYDVPTNSKDYIHRVGRTARAGRTGRSITLVTQYDVEPFQKIEQSIRKKLKEYPIGEVKITGLQEQIGEALQLANTNAESKKTFKRKYDTKN
jgi:ATP-dependent RNA helicase DDX47/RRP3